MKPLLILKTYAWLVNTISNKGPISYKDIIGLWKKDRLSEGNSMVRQTFIHYKNDLEEFFNISIGMDKMYRYYIKSGDALQKDTVENWMLTSLSVNTALLNNKKVYKRIVMGNTPSAGGFLKEIVEAMMKNVMLDIVYHRYDHSCDRQHRLAPYFVSFSSGYTTLAAGIVLSIMILPLLVSLFVELFSSVGNDLRDSSYALGATRWQTAQSVVLRKSMPGVFASVVLAVSRALGETIAVLMVCGNMAAVPHSVFDACYPIPALIANNYGEMLSLPMYESALMFAALLLFVVVLVFNLASRLVLRKIERK